jgi:hypothetical protein
VFGEVSPIFLIVVVTFIASPATGLELLTVISEIMRSDKAKTDGGKIYVMKTKTIKRVICDLELKSENEGVPIYNF